MQLMLAQKCAECRPDAFQMQAPTRTSAPACPDPTAYANPGPTAYANPGPTAYAPAYPHPSAASCTPRPGTTTSA